MVTLQSWVIFCLLALAVREIKVSDAAYMAQNWTYEAVVGRTVEIKITDYSGAKYSNCNFGLADPNPLFLRGVFTMIAIRNNKGNNTVYHGEYYDDRFSFIGDLNVGKLWFKITSLEKSDEKNYRLGCHTTEGQAYYPDIFLKVKYDVNECLINKGGCSHECTNLEGSYRCSCPDPELSLAPDGMTCIAQGVTVLCRSKYMSITLPKSLLRGLDSEHLRLNDVSCPASETASHFTLNTSLSGCGTTRRMIQDSVVYHNRVIEIPVESGGLITRILEVEIPFSCFYSKYGIVSAVGINPKNRKLVFSDSGTGNFTITLDLFPDQRFVSPYNQKDFPVNVVIRKRLYFQVNVNSSDKDLSVFAQDCYGTPTQNQNDTLKYFFIQNGCPRDDTVSFHSASTVDTKRFSIEAFKFISDHPFVFIHCRVRVCNGSDSQSRCARGCESLSRRKRRDADESQFYGLSEGPFILDSNDNKKQEKANFLGKNISGSVVAAMLIACVACLVGVAAIVAKNKRSKYSKYYPLEVMMD